MKKLIALLLMLAMVLSTISMSVIAAEEETEERMPVTKLYVGSVNALEIPYGDGWSFDAENGVLTLNNCTLTEAVVHTITHDHGDGEIYYNRYSSVIYFTGDGCNGAARLADGKDIWRRHDASKSSAGVPLVIGEHVYFYLRATLVKLNAKTGELVWKDGKVPGSSSTIGGVCVKDGRVLAVSTNALVVDNDADGKRIYRRI